MKLPNCLQEMRFLGCLMTAELMRSEILKNVDNSGLVHNVCGSPTFAEPGTAVEGQAFFLLLEAAYEKYTETKQ